MRRQRAQISSSGSALASTWWLGRLTDGLENMTDPDALASIPEGVASGVKSALREICDQVNSLIERFAPEIVTPCAHEIPAICPC